jgi:two-component system, OmpR family, response regulator ChvI
MQMLVDTVEALERAPLLLSRLETETLLHIVAIDEDDCFRASLSSELGDQGFSVTTFADGHSVLEAVDSVADTDLIVLDWDHSAGPGLTLLRQLRRAGINTPIVFLTRRSLPRNESLALANGAVDFIEKSRGHLILAYRLKVVVSMKVPQRQRDKAFTLGELLLKPQISRAFWKGVDLDLTVGEFRIVALLAADAGHHVTYRGLYDVLHHHSAVAECSDSSYKTNLRSAIRRIRRKFETLDPTFSRIQNYAAFGYLWAKD